MDGFQVNVTIQDCFINKCCRNCIQRDTLVDSVTQTITLQCNFILNVIHVSSTYFTVLIQDGVNVIIRNIFTSHSTSLCLPNECGKHIITICGTITQNT